VILALILIGRGWQNGKSEIMPVMPDAMSDTMGMPPAEEPPDTVSDEDDMTDPNIIVPAVPSGGPATSPAIP
jgi:hypothetical protein